MEPPSPEASWASDPEEPDRCAGSAPPDRPGGDTGTPRDAATGPLAEENAFQGLPDESWADIIRYRFWEEISAKTNQSSALLFLEKLWKMVNSHRFQSRWGDNGNCVVITERLFKKEVLRRRGPQEIFETDSMRGFLLQINLYGFCKMEVDSLISASIEELRAVAAAGSALGKVRRFLRTRKSPRDIRGGTRSRSDKISLYKIGDGNGSKRADFLSW
ncbi:HSFY1 protein, partial [Anhinga anhinga]|nr:HSFY1 protein [Anhinga anhinga]